MSNSYYPQPRPPILPYRPVPNSYPRLPKRPRRRLPIILLFTGLTLAMITICGALVLGSTLFSFLGSFNRLTTLPLVNTPVPTLTPLKVYQVVGKPTINAQFINSVLEYYNSPASRKGQALYDDGVKVGINPAYALAFFLEESNFGTKGVATVTHALGNIRAVSGEAQYKGYRAYKTWEAGFADWYKLISEKYVGQWHLTTVEKIIPIYAPSSDANDEGQYIRTIKIAIERWRNGYVDV
ncbi:MAG: glucosaminidase domain-containing protein [Ktedonobacteraceae bacterium]|nr:glucosaminidase domain-containing protein [Ktedonobacteraceae bacterium]